MKVGWDLLILLDGVKATIVIVFCKLWDDFPCYWYTSFRLKFLPYLACASMKKLVLTLSSAALAFNGAFVPVIAHNHGPAPEPQFCEMGKEPCVRGIPKCRPAPNKGPNKPYGVPNIKNFKDMPYSNQGIQCKMCGNYEIDRGTFNNYCVKQ